MRDPRKRTIGFTPTVPAGTVPVPVAMPARIYLVAGGIIYLALWIYGLVIDHDSAANLIPLNNADNWLHLVLGVGMVALGLLLTRPNRGSRDVELR